jgi:hypothetical protein
MKVAKLEVTSWAGVAIGAEHFYGSFNWCDESNDFKEHRLTKTISQKEASYLNKKMAGENTDYIDSRYREGDEVNCFDTVEEVRKVAMKNWRDITGCDLLLGGSFACASVEFALDGPDQDVVDRINDLYKQAVEIDFYEDEELEDQMNLIDELFRKIVEGPA